MDITACLFDLREAAALLDAQVEPMVQRTWVGRLRTARRSGAEIIALWPASAGPLPLAKALELLDTLSQATGLRLEEVRVVDDRQAAQHEASLWRRHGLSPTSAVWVGPWSDLGRYCTQLGVRALVSEEDMGSRKPHSDDELRAPRHQAS